LGPNAAAFRKSANWSRSSPNWASRAKRSRSWKPPCSCSPPRAEIHRKLADLDSEHRRLAEQIEADQAKDKPKKDESK
jgi:hypothetical protein